MSKEDKSNIKKYPDYIALPIKIDQEKKNNEVRVKDLKDWESTCLRLKEIEEKLPYSEFYYSEFYKNDENERIYKEFQRVGDPHILLRLDHITPEEIFQRGGFQPHCLYPPTDKKIDNFHQVPSTILNPGAHTTSSKYSGCVSTCFSMDYLKNFTTDEPKHIYMVKVVGGFYKGNDSEFETVAPGGIDAPEDIVAFRRLKGSLTHSFDQNEPLYVNENFIRRYPDLLGYILKRYLESNECCPEAKNLIEKLPGFQAKTCLSENTSLEEVKEKVILILNKYISNYKMPLFKHHHDSRAKQVRTAIIGTKNIDEIWYILNNQLELFESPLKVQGTFGIPGLSARFYSSSCLKNKNPGGYVTIIKEALSILPRIKIRGADDFTPIFEKNKRPVGMQI